MAQAKPVFKVRLNLWHLILEDDELTFCKRNVKPEAPREIYVPNYEFDYLMCWECRKRLNWMVDKGGE